MLREQDIRLIRAIGNDVLVALLRLSTRNEGGKVTLGALSHKLKETLTPTDISVALGLLWGVGLVNLEVVEVSLTPTGIERVTQHLAEQRELPKLEGGP